MFPDHCLNLEDFYPLAHEMIIRQVLIPETAVRIIQADLNLDTEAAAAAIIADSHMFGIVLHPTYDDCPFLENALRIITEKNRHTQSAARSWESSGTDLSLNEWIQAQRELSAVKSEPQEPSIPQMRREVIDLTWDD
jgi:hypothetical protein